MSVEKASALILKVVDFSETSCVLTLFTREFGKVRGLAKGARRPKGPFESAIDLMAHCRIVFLRKSSDALDLLTEAKLERRFRVAAHDASGLYAGYYVIELLREMTEDYDPHPELFDIADQTLAVVSSGGNDLLRAADSDSKETRPQETSLLKSKETRPLETSLIARQIFRFELTALRLLGHLPSLDVCVECGRQIEPKGRIAFGHLEGGVLCRACRPGKRKVVSASAAAIGALQRFAAEEDSSWRSLEIDRSLRGELRGILNHYISQLAGREMRMHRYLTQTT